MRLPTCLLALLCIGAFLPPQANAERIIWLLSDWPPFQYKEGSDFKGYSTNALKVLLGYLPGYTHDLQLANFKRRKAMFSQGQPVCSFGLAKKTEREAYMHYSIPAEIYFPVQLFMREKTFTELGKPTIVSLSQLLEDKKGVLGTTTGVSFGQDVDNIIGNKALHNQIYFNEAGTIARQLFGMLALRRIDYLVEYPPEGQFAAQNFARDAKLTSVIIEEAQRMVLAYVTCSKSDWGKDMIRRINQVLIAVRPLEEYRKGYESYLDPHLLPAYRKQYEIQLLKQAR